MRKLEVGLALYRLLDSLRESGANAGDRGEIRNGGLAHPPHASEPTQQRALLGRADQRGHGPPRALRGGALNPATQALAHIREVVVATDFLPPKPPIRVLRRPPVLEHDHRAHDARALHVAHVVALDALRRPLEA